MWSNGAVWSAGGYYGYSGSLSECLQKLYTELSAGRPVIVHLKNTAVSGVKRHTNRTSSYEYHLTSSGWNEVNYQMCIRDRRSTERDKRELVGARPLHLADARPFGRLKAPLGLSLFRFASQTRIYKIIFPLILPKRTRRQF